MNRNSLFASIAALSMIAAAAPAAAARGQDAPEATAQKADKKICRKFDNTTSRMKSTKLCLTKAEWRKFEDAR
ncbi:MAG TPA: hypothetical protein VGB62_07660 [Allosphingosinicella sp.]|jgi:Spy/CpxP family protein refolding chaperone